MAEMTAQEAAEWGKTLNFETVWATITRMGEKVDRTTENINKMGERIDKTTIEFTEMCKKVDKTTENINRMGERVGRTTENVNKMDERVDKTTTEFTEYDLKRAYQRLPLYDGKSPALALITPNNHKTGCAYAVPFLLFP